MKMPTITVPMQNAIFIQDFNFFFLFFFTSSITVI